MHLAGTIAIDFLTVPTVTFNVLYVFFVLSLDRRRILHINVTAHPSAEWAAQQIVEAVGFDTSIARLIRRGPSATRPQRQRQRHRRDVSASPSLGTGHEGESTG